MAHRLPSAKPSASCVVMATFPVSSTCTLMKLNELCTSLAMVSAICVHCLAFFATIAHSSSTCVGGRVCRPLIVCEKGVPLVTQGHLDQLAANIRTFDDFIRDGLVEWLDVNEENNCKSAFFDCIRLYLVLMCSGYVMRIQHKWRWWKRI